MNSLDKVKRMIHEPRGTNARTSGKPLRSATKVVVVGLAVAGILAGCGSTASSTTRSSSSKTSAGSTTPLPQYTETNVPSELGYFAAFQQGLFQRNGLSPTVHVVSPANTLAPLISGKEPAAVLSAPQVVSGIAEGAHLEVIGNLYNSLVFQVWAAPSVKTTKDIVGQKVAITTTAGLFAEGLSQLLPMVGVSVSQVHYVNYGTIPEMLAGALSGNVTVLPAIPGATTVALAAKGWHELINPPDVMSKSPISGVPIVTTAQEIKKDPGLLQKYIDAITEGIKAVKTDPTVADAVLSTPPYFTVSAGSSTAKKAAIDAAYNYYKGGIPCVASVTSQEFASTIAFTAQTKPNVKSLNMANYIDDKFVNTAKASGLAC